MMNRSSTWVEVARAVLLFVLATGCTREAANPTVQTVADQVSQTHYQKYHLDVEDMGLGLYGGAEYNMGYRNRRYPGRSSPDCPGGQASAQTGATLVLMAIEDTSDR